MKRSQRSIAVDTGPLLGLIDVRDAEHQSCMQALQGLPTGTQMVSSLACLTELSFLLSPGHAGRDSVAKLITLLGIRFPETTPSSLLRVFELQDQYADLPMDFADACIVEICERLDVTSVFTIDRRDFGIYRPKHVKRLEIIP